MSQKKDRVLVVVQLSGGNDYLNCIVPYADPRYQDARPNIRIEQDDVIPLDDNFGLNPGMGVFKDIYDEGNVAIIHGVGYPVPVRSHFRSMDIWHTANPNELGNEGWLGQAIRAIDPAGDNPVTAVNFGHGLPRALASPGVPVASVGNLDDYGLLTGVNGERQREQALNAFSRIYSPRVGSSLVMDYLGKTGLDALRGADILKEAPKRYSSTIEYPSNAIGTALKGVAQIHFADLGTRIFYTVHGGFDTHTNEVALQKVLWQELSEALRAFKDDLNEHRKSEEIAILIFSEFGRRVKDNGSGTDHGSGGVAFVLGDAVQGGHYSEYPSLDPSDLTEGDLAYNFDFRGLYTDMLEDWLGIEATPIVGGGFEKIQPFAVSA
ncbi:MAG: DUF1501 domain-containing protein [Chloroflexi bacterium]|nr:DUF1501 domain-containing protein [Chloroflexota bacterium]